MPEKEPKGFHRAEEKAKKLIGNSDRLKQLLGHATGKMLKSAEKLKGTADDVQAFIRLVRNYYQGNYREVSLSVVVYALAAIIYFVNPLDIIPDFIVGFGFLDDITVITFVLNHIKKEIDAFRDWEKTTPIEIQATDD